MSAERKETSLRRSRRLAGLEPGSESATITTPTNTPLPILSLSCSCPSHTFASNGTGTDARDTEERNVARSDGAEASGSAGPYILPNASYHDEWADEASSTLAVASPGGQSADTGASQGPGEREEPDGESSSSPRPEDTTETARVQLQSLVTRAQQRARPQGLIQSFSEHLGAPVQGESFCQCPKKRQSKDLHCTCGEEDTVFEWVWDRNTKSAAAEISEDGRDVRFHVNYSSGTAAARGNELMTDRQYFWEIKMITPVYGTDMMVGVGTATVDLDAFRYTFCSILGRDAESWGLSYYGKSQHKGEILNHREARFGQGSILGMHLDTWLGRLTFYKNRKPLGAMFTGLRGKALYPMVSSTAARTGMKLIKACSYSTSLGFLCCSALRKLIPSDKDVTSALGLPPGLREFLTNNLSWLLRPNELAVQPKQAQKRTHLPDESEVELQSKISRHCFDFEEGLSDDEPFSHEVASLVRGAADDSDDDFDDFVSSDRPGPSNFNRSGPSNFNRPSPFSDRPGPSSDRPGPSSDRPGPSSDQPGPSSDRPIPTSDRLGRSFEQPGPSSDRPGPSSDQPGPSSDRPIPTSDRLGRSLEQPGPSSYRPGPSSDRPGPSSDLPGPSSDPLGLSSDHLDPSFEHADPTLEQPGLSFEQSGPSSEHSNTSFQQPGPATT